MCNANIEEPMVSLKELADLLEVDVRALKKYIQIGAVPRPAGRTVESVYWFERDLIVWMESSFNSATVGGPRNT
jgi:predicted DNA-binding transcriptional regulator AlpA